MTVGGSCDNVSSKYKPLKAELMRYSAVDCEAITYAETSGKGTFSTISGGYILFVLSVLITSKKIDIFNERRRHTEGCFSIFGVELKLACRLNLFSSRLRFAPSFFFFFWVVSFDSHDNFSSGTGD